jgi:hypothetical protein
MVLTFICDSMDNGTEGKNTTVQWVLVQIHVIQGILTAAD